MSRNTITRISPSLATKRANGLRIDFYRRRAGLTQAELAEKLRIRRETLSRLEAGKQYLTEGMELRIARTLDISDDERNHMLGLALGAGKGAAKRAPRPGSDSSQRLWLVGASSGPGVEAGS